MTAFRYRARAADGTMVSGVLEAADRFEAADRIRQTYPVVERIRPVRERRLPDLREPMRLEERSLSMAAGQFAILLEAGLSLGRILELISGQTEDRLLGRILRDCAPDVEAGRSLAASLERHGAKIPAVFLESVRAGEESGTLEESFRALERYYEKAHQVREKVRSALTYPVLVLVLAVVVVGIVMVVLVPVMTGIFGELQMELPLPTRILMAVSRGVQRFWPLVLLLTGGAGTAILLWGRTLRGRVLLSRLRLHLPVLGGIARLNAAAQTSSTLATLLEAGMPVTRALEITGRVLDLRCVGETLSRGVPRLESGTSLGEVLGDVAELPPLLAEMARVGEESGSLETALKTVSRFYDSEALRASDRALGLLEPMITVILGTVVGGIVIAIYLPIFQMSGSLGL